MNKSIEVLVDELNADSNYRNIDYTFNKYNAQALNKLRNIMYTAKYTDSKRNVTIMCIDRAEVAEDVQTIVNSEFMPLFNTKYDFNDFRK